MIEPELSAKLEEIEKKVDAAYRAAESARKYLFWTGVITAALIILPLIGLAFAIPAFLNSYVGTISSYTSDSGSGAGSAPASSTASLLTELGL